MYSFSFELTADALLSFLRLINTCDASYIGDLKELNQSTIQLFNKNIQCTYHIVKTSLI